MQLIGGFMSYLRYLCLFAESGVQYILCSVFLLIVYAFVDNLYGLSIFDWPFCIL